MILENPIEFGSSMIGSNPIGPSKKSTNLIYCELKYLIASKDSYSIGVYNQLV